MAISFPVAPPVFYIRVFMLLLLLLRLVGWPGTVL